MKNRLLSIFIIFSLICCLFLGNTIQASADPFTAAQIGAASYAAMASWGINFTSGNATAVGMGDFMGTQVDSYVDSLGGTIATVFGSQLVIEAAGKFSMGSQMYNAIIDFKDWLVNKYTLDNTDQNITSGYYNGTWLDEVSEVSGISEIGYSVVFSNYEEPTTSKPFGGYRNYQGYSNGQTKGKLRQADSAFRFLGQWYLTASESGDNYIIRNITPEVNYETGDLYNYQVNVATISKSALQNSLSWNGSEYIAPTVIDPSYEWVGQVGDYQDTNLEQLLNHVLEDVEGNNLVVEGEIAPLDPPQPTPTPIPIDPGTPLQNVPWEGLDNNLNNLYEQGLEEIGKIGEAQNAITGKIDYQTGVVQDLINGSTNSVTGAINNQTGVVEDLINGGTGIISGAINQASSDIQTSIGAQTEALAESLSATAAGVETIAEALEDESINWPKFNLSGFFPFCIPFDIYNALQALDANPIAPHVELPFVIPSIGFSYTIDLDFSSFDQVAAVMRQMELLVYGIALAWATSKVIKW